MINDLNSEDIIGACYEKELQNTNQKELRIEKLIKKKGNKLYFKWKGYDNWIYEKDIVKLICKKLVKIFLNHMEETLTLKLIYLII